MERWARKFALIVALALTGCVTAPSSVRPRVTLRMQCWERSVNYKDGWVRLAFRTKPFRSSDGQEWIQDLVVFFEIQNDPRVLTSEWATVTIQGDGDRDVEPFFK